MATTVLLVPDISCEHCARTVTEALESIEGVKQVTVDIPTQRVRIEYDEDRAEIDQMREALAEEEYPVATVER